MASDHGKSITDIENFGPDGTDFRIRKLQSLTNSSVTSSPLSASEIGDYFFLPAFGSYEANNGTFYFGGGYYWSSTAVGEITTGDQVHAYGLAFNSNQIYTLSSWGRGTSILVARKFE